MTPILVHERDWRAVVFCGTIVPGFTIVEEGGEKHVAGEGTVRYDVHELLAAGQKDTVVSFCATWNMQFRECPHCLGYRQVCLPVPPNNPNNKLTSELAADLVTYFQETPGIVSPHTN